MRPCEAEELRCSCAHVTDEAVSSEAAAEGCAARALALRASEEAEEGNEGAGGGGGRALFAFHVREHSLDAGISRCVVERCEGEECTLPADADFSCLALPDPSPAWRTYAPRDLCPEGAGATAVLAEVGTMAAAGTGAAEFTRVFGPTLLRHDQVLRGLHAECSLTAHRVAAEVCFTGAGTSCDVWSKYALPRCHVSLGLPYDPTDASFLYAPACERTGQMFCPPTVPVALQVTLKAGSRSAVVWAAMLEGLTSALVAARRTLAAALSEGAGTGGASEGRLRRYVLEWLEHEEARLGCTEEASLFSISRALHMFADEGKLGLPLALCPTCCQTAAARLRVIFLRSPLSRLRSFYRGYWEPRKGHLLEGGFPRWVELILRDGATNTTLFEATDLDHVAPALRAPPDPASPFVIFTMEDVAGSLRRMERALCAEPFRHCAPLPPFPATVGRRAGRGEGAELLSGAALELVQQRFRFDLEALQAAGTG